MLQLTVQEFNIEVPHQWHSFGERGYDQSCADIENFVLNVSLTRRARLLRLNFGSNFLSREFLPGTREFVQRFVSHDRTHFDVQLFFSIDTDDFDTRIIELLSNYCAYSSIRFARRSCDLAAVARSLPVFQLLRKTASDGLIRPPAAIYTLSQKDDAGVIYQTLFRICGFTSVNIELAHADLYESPETTKEHASLLRDLFAIWLREDNPNHTITLFYNIVRALRIGPEELFSPPGRDQVVDAISIGADGAITRFDGGAGQEPQRSYMNVNECDRQPLAMFFKDYYSDINELKKTPTQCRKCVWRKVCRSGEYKYRVRRYGGWGESKVCDLLDQLFTDITEKLLVRGLPFDVIAKNLGDRSVSRQ